MSSNAHQFYTTINEYVTIVLNNRVYTMYVPAIPGLYINAKATQGKYLEEALNTVNISPWAERKSGKDIDYKYNIVNTQTKIKMNNDVIEKIFNN